MASIRRSRPPSKPRSDPPTAPAQTHRAAVDTRLEHDERHRVTPPRPPNRCPGAHVALVIRWFRSIATTCAPEDPAGSGRGFGTERDPDRLVFVSDAVIAIAV